MNDDLQVGDPVCDVEEHWSTGKIIQIHPTQSRYVAVQWDEPPRVTGNSDSGRAWILRSELVRLRDHIPGLLAQ
jgi:hypothetical protein